MLKAYVWKFASSERINGSTFIFPAKIRLKEKLRSVQSYPKELRIFRVENVIFKQRKTITLLAGVKKNESNKNHRCI